MTKFNAERVRRKSAARRAAKSGLTAWLTSDIELIRDTINRTDNKVGFYTSINAATLLAVGAFLLTGPSNTTWRRYVC